MSVQMLLSSVSHNLFGKYSVFYRIYNWLFEQETNLFQPIFEQETQNWKETNKVIDALNISHE